MDPGRPFLGHQRDPRGLSWQAHVEAGAWSAGVMRMASQAALTTSDSEGCRCWVRPPYCGCHSATPLRCPLAMRSRASHPGPSISQPAEGNSEVVANLVERWRETAHLGAEVQ